MKEEIWARWVGKELQYRLEAKGKLDRTERETEASKRFADTYAYDLSDKRLFPEKFSRTGNPMLDNATKTIETGEIPPGMLPTVEKALGKDKKKRRPPAKEKGHISVKGKPHRMELINQLAKLEGQFLEERAQRVRVQSELEETFERFNDPKWRS